MKNDPPNKYVKLLAVILLTSVMDQTIFAAIKVCDFEVLGKFAELIACEH